jgi:hypothetical protein
MVTIKTRMSKCRTVAKVNGALCAEAEAALDHPRAAVTARFIRRRWCRPGPVSPTTSASSPYAVVGDDVELGRGTSVGPHAQLQGPAVFGEDNRIFAHAVLGFEPQDLKYHGRRRGSSWEAERLPGVLDGPPRHREGGRREHRGRRQLLHGLRHVAHDSRIGSGTVFANCASLAVTSKSETAPS